MDRYQLGTALFVVFLAVWTYVVSSYWSYKAIGDRLSKPAKIKPRSVNRKHLTYIEGGKPYNSLEKKYWEL